MDTRSLNERIAKAKEWGYAGDTGQWGYLPNWAGDLNLMHELEKDLTEDERQKYGFLLVAQVEEDEKISLGLAVDALREITALDCFRFAHATPATKARAWLKVKELQEAEHDSTQ